MLGSDVARAAARAGWETAALGHSELDITDAAAVAEAFGRIRPEAAINCAAWTDVDGAEANREQAWVLNGTGAGNLAHAAAEAGAPLVHVSTDYVFSGEPPRDGAGAPRPYVESDRVGPRTAYGETKLVGEGQVLAASRAHTVVRTAWLFGVDGGNFAATMLRLAREGAAAAGGSGEETPDGQGQEPVQPSVRVVTDQIGCPTWTGHLAPALIGLIERGVSGLVHLAGSGHVSWNGYAKEIFRQAEVDCRVEDATTEEMARPAPRPAWSALESERADVLPMPPWQDGVAGYLAALGMG
jgi:dTDP-4-dehydrorhamnose reductase